jgi:hypothetical protein
VLFVFALTIGSSKDPEATPIDWWGALLIGSAVAVFVFGVIEAPLRGWSSPIVHGCLTAGVALAMALAVAAQRAAETAQDNPLIRDEFAAVLVASVDEPGWQTMARGDPSWMGPEDDIGRRTARTGREYVATRTVFFDEFCSAATASGIRQVVILAAGLDARAYRPEPPKRPDIASPASTELNLLQQLCVIWQRCDGHQKPGCAPRLRQPQRSETRHNLPALSQ